MRIVEWAEFQTLKPGTVYQEVFDNRGDLGDLMILGEIWHYDGKASDFVEARLLPEICDYNTFDEAGRAHVGAKDGDEVIIQPSGFGRDGFFDLDKRRWLVWDEADRKCLAGWLLNPDKAVSEMNDEAHAFVHVPRRTT